MAKVLMMIQVASSKRCQFLVKFGGELTHVELLLNSFMMNLLSQPFLAATFDFTSFSFCSFGPISSTLFSIFGLKNGKSTYIGFNYALNFVICYLNWFLKKYMEVMFLEVFNQIRHWILKVSINLLLKP